jgi:hypothetical protein
MAGFRGQKADLGWLLSMAILLSLGAAAQNQSSPASSSRINSDLSLNAESLDRSIWENAKPHIDDSLSDLEAALSRCSRKFHDKKGAGNSGAVENAREMRTGEGIA